MKGIFVCISCCLASFGRLNIQFLSTLFILEDKLSIGGQRCVCSKSLTLQKPSSKKKMDKILPLLRLKLWKEGREVIFLSKGILSL